MNQARWMLFIWMLPLLLGVAASETLAAKKFQAQALPPLAASAEYYLQHRQFDRALELYRQLNESDKTNPQYWERTATLALYVEGRASAQQVVQSYFAALGSAGLRRNADSLDTFLNALFGTFVTDRAQGLFLQGQVRSDRGDCEGALGFFRQALDLDAALLPVLVQQIHCQMRLEQYSQAYEDLKAAVLLNPFSVPLAEQLAEMHLYFGFVALSLDSIRQTQKHRSLSARLLVAEAVALARKTDREAAWQAFRKLDLVRGSSQLPPILLWEKATLLETDPRRKSALAKSQLTQWLQQFLARSKKLKPGFDPYKTTTLQDPARKWLASLQTPAGH